MLVILKSFIYLNVIFFIHNELKSELGYSTKNYYIYMLKSLLYCYIKKLIQMHTLYLVLDI